MNNKQYSFTLIMQNRKVLRKTDWAGDCHLASICCCSMFRCEWLEPLQVKLLKSSFRASRFESLEEIFHLI